MAVRKNISGEQAFQVEAHSFAVSPSDSGYTFAYSADGTDYTLYDEATPSGENLIVNGISRGLFVRLVGNTDDVIISY